MPLFTTQVHEQKTLATGNVATIQVPPNMLDIQSCALIFYTAAGAPAAEADIRGEISNIRVAVNGIDVVNAPPAALLNAYETLSTRVGVPASGGSVDGTIELNVGRLLFVDPDARSFCKWGMLGVNSVQITVQAGTLLNIASVKCVTQRSGTATPLDNYVEFLTQNVSFNSTGDNVLDTLPRNLDAAALLINVNPGASGVIARSGIVLNGTVTITDQLTDTRINGLFCSNKGFAQPSGYFSHILTDGTVGSNLPFRGISDYRLVTNFSTAPGAGGYRIEYANLRSKALAA